MVFSSKRAKLPKTINFVEYLQSSGTQFIKSGVKPTNNTRVVCNFQFVDTASTQYLFCARGAAGGYANRFGLLLVSTGFRSDFGSTNVTFPTSIDKSARHTVDKNGANCSIDGVSVTNTDATFTGSYEMNLFAGNTGGSMSEPAKAKIYSCQIYEAGLLIRDYWPCYDPKGVACLYDKVNEEYVYNAGTGEFIAGGAAA